MRIGPVEIMKALTRHKDFALILSEILSDPDSELSPELVELKASALRKKHSTPQELRKTFGKILIEYILKHSVSHKSIIRNVSIDGDTFRRLIGPGVYLFRAKDGSALYVGSGKRVINRATEETHESARMAADLCESVEIHVAASEGAARGIEAAVICNEKPMLNKILHQNHFN